MNFARLFSFCLLLSAAALMWEVLDTTDLNLVDRKARAPKTTVPADPVPDAPPAPIAMIQDDRPVQRVAKSAEVIDQEVDLLCRSLNQKFDQNKIDRQFARVDFKFHEKRLREMKFNTRLRKCFSNVPSAKNRVEIDVFSADFKGENAADLVELQVSIFDKKSRNKIFEAGQSLDLSTSLDLPIKAEVLPQ